MNPTQNPLSYRLERHGYVFNEVIVNIMEMLIIWVACFGLEAAFVFMRAMCFRVHYFGYHFTDLERSFRYQIFIRGFQVCFLKLVFHSLLNIRAASYADEQFSKISIGVSVGILVLSTAAMAFILVYVFALRKIPLYKMRRKTIFNMIYDDFKLKNISRFSLLFYLFFFFKRIVYALLLVFLADTNVVPLDIFIFVVCIIPMLYFSYALPFKFFGVNALLCINEFSETVVAVTLLHYQSWDIEDDEFFGYAEFLIIYIAIWIWINIAIFLIQLIRSIITICVFNVITKERRFREKTPSTSGSSTPESSEEEPRTPTPEPTPPVSESISEVKEPTPQVTPEESEDENDFIIPAMAVFVDEKDDTIHQVVHEGKSDASPS